MACSSHVGEEVALILSLNVEDDVISIKSLGCRMKNHDSGVFLVRDG
jgi:hypothetical protein